MRYASIPLAQTVVQHLEARGISNIVISPGSRNAPLTISFTENPFFRCYSIVDERSAAFFALGMAQYLNAPVAVVCTSGSALLNYYPAVAEAFYSEIPLVVISADRPSYKIDVGDGQTIRQDNVFDRHIGYNANLKQDVSHAKNRIARYSPEWLAGGNLVELQSKRQAYNDMELNQALQVALQAHLPIHINAPFEEPLYDFLDAPTVKAGMQTEYAEEGETLEMERFLKAWHNAARKMVLVGVSAPGTLDAAALQLLADDPTVTVMTETTSNLHHYGFLNSIDTIVAPIALSADKEALFKKLQPEILVTFGGLIVSKKIKAFLREYRPKEHWHVGLKRANDTFFCLTDHIKCTPKRFFAGLYEDGPPPKESDYARFWLNKKEHHRAGRERYLKQIPFSDFQAFEQLLKKIPHGHNLHLANSSTVRYAQLFDLHPSLRVYCNRGTSGIDGSTSTAVGASVYDSAPTLLISGDLSFFYDSNAFWNNYVRKDFRVIVLNNGGGGIFRILPGKEETFNFETFFETTHTMNARGLCIQFDMDYYSARNGAEVERALSSFFDTSEKPKILEIFTPRITNDKILMEYFHFIS